MEKEYTFSCNVEYEISTREDKAVIKKTAKDLIVVDKEILNVQVIAGQLTGILEKKHNRCDVELTRIDIRSVKENNKK